MKALSYLNSNSDEEDFIAFLFLQQIYYKPIQFPRFDENSLSEEEFYHQFRFQRNDVARLMSALQIPTVIIGENGSKAFAREAMLILLKRLSYPNRLRDLGIFFGRNLTEISNITKSLMRFIFEKWNHLLIWNNSRLNEEKFRLFSNAISNAGGPIRNCIGFIDGTMRAICRPKYFQNEFYNGHKRICCLKFQNITCPDGIIIHMSGPYRGTRHDAGMLYESDLINILENRLTFLDTQYCIYGDLAYPLIPVLLKPYFGAQITQEQNLFNQNMSKLRIAVEWSFGKICKEFAFVDFKKNQKIYLQPVGKYYAIATLLTNCHTCFYGSQVSSFFNLNPPEIENYLIN